MSGSNLVFVDVETTDVDPDRRIHDFGAVIYTPTGGRREMSCLVSDVDLSGANMASLKVGHFRERHPLAGAASPPGTDLVTEQQLARELFPILYGATVAGVVVNFDTHALHQMFMRHRLTLPSYHHLLCVENRALGALQVWAHLRSDIAEAHAEILEAAEQVPPRWDTDAIAAAFGVPETPKDQRHTALGDARLAERIYHAAVVDKVMPAPGARWEIPDFMLLPNAPVPQRVSRA